MVWLGAPYASEFPQFTFVSKIVFRLCGNRPENRHFGLRFVICSTVETFTGVSRKASGYFMDAVVTTFVVLITATMVLKLVRPVILCVRAAASIDEVLHGSESPLAHDDC